MLLRRVPWMEKSRDQERSESGKKRKFNFDSKKMRRFWCDLAQIKCESLTVSSVDAAYSTILRVTNCLYVALCGQFFTGDVISKGLCTFRLRLTGRQKWDKRMRDITNLARDQRHASHSRWLFDDSIEISFFVPIVHEWASFCQMNEIMPNQRQIDCIVALSALSWFSLK